MRGGSCGGDVSADDKTRQAGPTGCHVRNISTIGLTVTVNICFLGEVTISARLVKWCILGKPFQLDIKAYYRKAKNRRLKSRLYLFLLIGVTLIALWRLEWLRLKRWIEWDLVKQH